MVQTFVNDADYGDLDDDDVKEIFNDGYIAGLHHAINLIEEQIEFHTATRQ